MVEHGNFSSSHGDFENEGNELCDECVSESTESEVNDDQCTSSSVEKENLELKNEVSELKNKILRVSAEYDNYRKRTTKEKSESYSNGMMDAIVNILPILDNLERARSIGGDVESLKKGIDMLASLFFDVLTKLGIEEIDATGNFDPNLHEAVSHISDENLGENVIVEVLQKGYKTSSKVIRHSMVKVAN